MGRVGVTVRCIARVGDELGEGPFWDGRTARLYWFDIMGRVLHALIGEAVRSWTLPWRASAGAPWGAEDLLLASEEGLFRFTPETGAFSFHAEIGGGAGVRSNDGKCGPDGRFWIGTMHDSARNGAGALYCVDDAGAVVTMRADVTIPNGLAWSPDGAILYWAESARGAIYTFAAPRAGEPLEQGHVFVDLRGQGVAPDGAATDAEGYLWSAHWDGWRVVRYAPDGRIERVLALPVQRPTCCAFGGPDLRTLFITSAWEGLTQAERAAQPHAGDLFALDVETPGCRVASFGA